MRTRRIAQQIVKDGRADGNSFGDEVHTVNRPRLRRTLHVTTNEVHADSPVHGLVDLEMWMLMIQTRVALKSRTFSSVQSTPRYSLAILRFKARHELTGDRDGETFVAR